MSQIQNRAYKKWLIKEGKDVPGMIKLFTDCIQKKQKMAFEIMTESEATFDQSGINTAVKFVRKQIEG